MTAAHDGQDLAMALETAFAHDEGLSEEQVVLLQEQQQLQKQVLPRRAAAVTGTILTAMGLLMWACSTVDQPEVSSLPTQHIGPLRSLSSECEDSLTEVNLAGDRTVEWLNDVGSPGECRDRCNGNNDCKIWVWSTRQQFCILKASGDPSQATHAHLKGVISGWPCRVNVQPVAPPAPPVQAAPPPPATPVAEVTPVVAPAPVAASGAGSVAGDSGPSLYCFLGIMLGTYEETLLFTQHTNSWSIFACAGWDVFASREQQLAPDVRTIAVNSDFKCDVGGDFGTALNTDIFLAIWDGVFAKQTFQQYAWTVKVDADTVFLPFRLRRMLASEPEPPNGVYINNCKFGMHGPMEVLSKLAVQLFQREKASCMDWLTGLCSGPCPFGEDMWLDKCLKHKGVRRVNHYEIMGEDHCDPDPDWNSCRDRIRAAFHPFKYPDEYVTCVGNALFSGPV